ncbi:hypothetical protein GW793_03780 [bacterium]|uniref:N-formylglutamate amidohydrolase n=1 Tax=candidate division WWE3 bacterium CG_4_9_14_3_um_filter_39_7 TaxID=1975080 RepID=A0A2M7X1N1_UNCKA|nr:hypothetical protein [bacterium]PJA40038.1 MAG: hypothetical protein CO179_03590 [candidate division WWE3 bacterium CG_4_9_14_3_um_filter_39_7]
MRVTEGTIPILLVAAHNTAHIRNGVRKPCDINTGKVVGLIAQKTRAFSIISTSVQIDPNWHIDSPFRQTLKELIKTHNIQAVIDIHGRKEGAKHLIEYCPNDAFTQKYPNLMYPQLDGTRAMRKFIDDEQLTISEDVDVQNIPSLQIEIRKDGRDFRKNTPLQIVDAVSELILKLASLGI